MTFATHNPQDLLRFFLTSGPFAIFLDICRILVIFNTTANFLCSKADLLYWPFDGVLVPHQLNEAERDSEQTSYHPSFEKRHGIKEHLFCTHISLVKKKCIYKQHKERERRRTTTTNDNAEESRMGH